MRFHRGRGSLTAALGCLGAVACAGPAEAATAVFQDATVAGDSASIRDTHLRSDPDGPDQWADGNFGTVDRVRLYPDVGFDAGKGPRHTLFWFDVSSIPPGSTINSATLDLYFQSNAVGGNTAGFSLGCFKVPWIEGVSNRTPADPGEPTWNSRQHGTTPWGAPGATGAADVYPDNKSFDADPASDHWESIPVTDWVQSWVNGTRPDYGMIVYGGQSMSGCFWINLSEAADTNVRPKLTVTYNSTGDPGVSIDLGTTNVGNGMTCPNTGDGHNVAATMGGVNCRGNVNPNVDYYMYFDVSNTYAYQGSRQRLDITIHYFDSGTGSLGLDYDAMGTEAYKQGGSFALSNTNTWKQHTFQITDAYFGDRENYVTDFRISCCCPGFLFYLDVVQVAAPPPGPAAPIIAEVSPDPDPVTAMTEYTRQLVLVQGNPAPTWTLVQGPPGAQVNSSTGRVSGWTPGPCEPGAVVTFEVQAENSVAPPDTETWQVSVQPMAVVTGPVLDEPLNGVIRTQPPNVGRSGGSLQADGWHVTGGLEYIYWHIIPTLTHGRFEYDIKGVSGCVGCCYGDGSPFQKNELSHMYDWTYENADTNYMGYRNGPYKHFIRRMCDKPPWTVELLWKMGGEAPEPDAGDGWTWDANTTYHMQIDWVPSGGGTDTTIRRNGEVLHALHVAEPWNPAGHSVKIGSSLRGEEYAYVGAVYSNVKVWDLSNPPPVPPIIQEVSPDPDTAWCGHEYSEQLVLLQGSPAPGWCLPNAPPGARINTATGLVNGWTPSLGDIGQQVLFTARAVNGGVDDESWHVIVKAKGDLDLDGDCDQEDFGRFQACLVGSGVFHPPGCEDADVDGDTDVDQDDFAVFQRCLSGANVPADPNCAN